MARHVRAPSFRNLLCGGCSESRLLCSYSQQGEDVLDEAQRRGQIVNNLLLVEWRRVVAVVFLARACGRVAEKCRCRRAFLGVLI